MKKILLLAFIFLISDLFASESPGKKYIRMATTTSTENSGLLDHIIPVFEKETGIIVNVIAVGTGKALTLGENGDVDLILVHARAREELFVRNNFGINRRDVMFNDFIILSPPDDPAGIRGMNDGASALKKIKDSNSDFLSRGDDSGTHTKEKYLWGKTGTVPQGRWYKESGQTMGAVIIMTNELNAYTLTDRGTYLAMKKNLSLKILVEGDNDLFNPYGIIAVNPEFHNNINLEGAMVFIDFITSAKGQNLINSFRKNGEQLFFGNSL